LFAGTQPTPAQPAAPTPVRAEDCGSEIELQCRGEASGSAPFDYALWTSLNEEIPNVESVESLPVARRFELDNYSDFHFLFPWAIDDLEPSNQESGSREVSTNSFIIPGIREVQLEPQASNMLASDERASHDFSNCQGVFDLTRPSIIFPRLEVEDEEVIFLEQFSHVTEPIVGLYDRITLFAKQQNSSYMVQSALTFPDPTCFDVFVQLYFEYFDAQMPFLHTAILDNDETSWILILAVATIGCQYSATSKRRDYVAGLQDLLRRAILIYAGLSWLLLT